MRNETINKTEGASYAFSHRAGPCQTGYATDTGDRPRIHRTNYFPTLARAEELVKAKKILAGGPVLGRVALRFIVEADSLSDVDKIITSLPIWPLAETRVTPLIAFSERRQHAEALLESLQKRS